MDLSEFQEGLYVVTKIETLEFKCIKISKNISDLLVKQKELPNEIIKYKNEIQRIIDEIPIVKQELEIVRKRIKRQICAYKRSNLRILIHKTAELLDEADRLNYRPQKVFDTIELEADHLLNLKRWIKSDKARAEELTNRLASFPRAKKDTEEALNRAIASSSSIANAIEREKERLLKTRAYLVEARKQMNLDELTDKVHKLQKMMDKQEDRASVTRKKIEQEYSPEFLKILQRQKSKND